MFWFAYQRDWPSILKIISKTTSWFEVGPWSCINRWCIIHELAERLPSSSGLGHAEMHSLASPGWLALWEGSSVCRVELRAGKAADTIKLICTDLGAVTGSPYEFTYGLLMLCLSDSSQRGSKIWGTQKQCEIERLPRHKCTCVLIS